LIQGAYFMSDDFQYDVFLSHRDKDKAVVRPLAERLRQDGLKVWLDEWEIPKADGRRQKAEGEIHPSSFLLHPLLEEGLEHSRVLVLCISAKTVRQIIFKGERFDAVSVQNWRKKVLGGS
jgi:hypothetical protein